MKLSARSFPHPVVGNNDDVPGAAFQGSVIVSSDAKNFYLALTINCSSATLNALIAEDKAAFTVHAECSNTLYRRAFSFKETAKTLTVSKEELNDTVEVNVFVCATKKVSGYTIQGAHPDYGSATFEISPGDILAISESYTFPAENDFDSMNRVGAIMTIKESSTDADAPMRLEPNGDKIVVLLSKADFLEYKTIRGGSESMAAPLTCAIVLPALMEAVNFVRRLVEDEEELPYRWMRILNDRMDAAGLSDEDALTVAQKLLELPIKRALAETRMLNDSGN